MPIFTPEKALSHLPQTPVILSGVLSGVDAERARNTKDGADGWSIVEIVGHLNDYEDIYMNRTRQMIAGDRTPLQRYNQEELVKAGGYAEKNIADVLDSFVSRRGAYIELLRSLSPEQWYCTAIHSSWGEITILEHATNGVLHDVNHIEQIVKTLGSAAP